MGAVRVESIGVWMPCSSRLKCSVHSSDAMVCVALGTKVL
jgi:hypothetical protein